MIVGGIAIIHYGHIRTTQDIDLIIEDKSEKFLEFLELLKKNEFDISETEFFQGHKEKSHISVFDKKSFLRLDIKIANKFSDNEVLNNAILKKVIDIELYLPPIEYVLLGKLMYIGNIDDIPDSELLEYQDITDFLTIYHVNKEKIKIDFLKEKVHNSGLESTYKRLLSLEF